MAVFNAYLPLYSCWQRYLNFVPCYIPNTYNWALPILYTQQMFIEWMSQSIIRSVLWNEAQWYQQVFVNGKFKSKKKKESFVGIEF